ncbi:unnamed protein product [Prunus armeniaca]
MTDPYPLPLLLLHHVVAKETSNHHHGSKIINAPGLVTKGYTQIEGLNYTETFAPVAKLVTIKCLLSIAAVRGWSLHQLDVQNAFLHSDLDKEVYMLPPHGFRR